MKVYLVSHQYGEGIENVVVFATREAAEEWVEDPGSVTVTDKTAIYGYPWFVADSRFAYGAGVTEETAIKALKKFLERCCIDEFEVVE